MTKYLTLILISIFFLNINAQNFKETEKKLIGKWIFVKTVDSNNNEINLIKQKGPNGMDMNIVAKGPVIEIYEDKTYTKKFTEVNTDSGNWKLISENEIEFEMVIPENSRQGKLIKQTQKFIPKKWRKDKDGSFLDASIDKIIGITENELKIEFQKNYIMIYRKS